MVGHNLNETLIQLIARKATGKGTLINLSVTENGNYDPADEDPPVDGYNYVSVSVETYEDELAQALADLAAAREQIADYQACQAAVISKLQEYDPDFDPQTCEDIVDKIEEEEEEKEEAKEALEEVAEEVGADPEDPTYPDNVLPAVKEGEGYTFPVGTTLPDVLTATGGSDYIQDTTLGIYLSYTDEITPSTLTVRIGYTTSDGVFHQKWQYTNDYASYEYVITSVDGTTGTVYYKIQFTSHGGTVFPWETDSFQDSALIGYGSSGHEFKAKNV